MQLVTYVLPAELAAYMHFTISVWKLDSFF